MTRAYEGDVASGEPYGLPAKWCWAKARASRRRTWSAMFVAMESVVASGIPLTGVASCICACLSGETGKHDAIKSLVDATGATAEMAFLGGTSLKLSLGNRGRLDVSIKVRGRSVHSSGPKNGCNAITGRWTYCAAWSLSISAGAMRASATRRLRSTAFVAFPRAPTRSKTFARSPLTDACCRRGPDAVFAEIEKDRDGCRRQAGPSQRPSFSCRVVQRTVYVSFDGGARRSHRQIFSIRRVTRF